MHINDDVHIVLGNGIGCDSLEKRDLISGVQLGARNLNPCCVRSWDSKDTNPSCGEGVNVRGFDERGITLLKDRTTEATLIYAETPFVCRAATILSPEDWVKDFLPSEDVSTAFVQISEEVWLFRNIKGNKRRATHCNSQPPRFTPDALNVVQFV